MSFNPILRSTKGANLDPAEVDQNFIDAAKESSRSGVQYFNRLADGGRFYKGAGDLGTDLAGGEFSVSEYLVSRNGSVLEDAGRFRSNNTTNGGSAGELSPSVMSLLTKFGKQNYRYGVEYHIVRGTAGSGTSSGPLFGTLRQTALLNSGLQAMSGGSQTHCFWLRKVSGSALAVEKRQLLHIDGSAQESDAKSIFDDNDWHFIVSYNEVNLVGSGYENHPGLYADSGTVYEIALPAVLPGEVTPDAYYWPILPAFDEGRHNNNTEAHSATIAAAVDSGVDTSREKFSNCVQIMYDHMLLMSQASIGNSSSPSDADSSNSVWSALAASTAAQPYAGGGELVELFLQRLTIQATALTRTIVEFVFAPTGSVDAEINGMIAALSSAEKEHITPVDEGLAHNGGWNSRSHRLNTICLAPGYQTLFIRFRNRNIDSSLVSSGVSVATELSSTYFAVSQARIYKQVGLAGVV